MDTLKPTDPSQVQDALRLAARDGKTVAVHLDVPADVRLDLSGLDAIVDIDAANLVAEVQAGVTLGTLRRALTSHNLCFIPAQTAFHDDMALGRYYFTGEPNLSSLKYGPAKQYLMGSQTVLGDGEILKTGGRTVKNVTGYDMTRFMNSAFAAFGVTTSYLLKILPAPEVRRPAVVAFDTLEAVLDFVEGLRQTHMVPAHLVWADDKMPRLLGFTGPATGQLVLLELDGLSEDVARQAETVQSLLETHRGRTLPEAEADAVRAGLAGLYTRRGGLTLTGEITVKPVQQRFVIEALYDWAQAKGLTLGLFGQAAEGKLSLCLPEADPQADDLVREVSEITLRQGGYVSGRHARLAGKAPEGPLADAELAMKRRFDPAGILKG